MNIIKEANSRMRIRQWAENIKQRRLDELQAALTCLDEAEYKASFPGNINRIAQLEEIRRTRAEITAMMNEEFGLEDEYRGHRGKLITTAPASSCWGQP